MKYIFSFFILITFLFNLFNIGVVFSNSSDHIATVHTTILPPVPAMGMTGQTPSIKEGESFEVKIHGGVPPYRVSSYDSAALTLRLDQTTGDLEVIGKQVVGNHTVQIEDVYKQKIQFGVSVLDATVILSSNTVGLVAGDSAVVAIQDYYVALEPHYGLQQKI